MLRPLLILFAKAPIMGRAKTRLCPPLAPAEAGALRSALVMVMDAGNLEGNTVIWARRYRER